MSLAKKRRARVASKSSGNGRKPLSSTTGCTRSVKVWPRAMREASMDWQQQGYDRLMLRLIPEFKFHPASFEAGWKLCVKARRLRTRKTKW